MKDGEKLRVVVMGFMGTCPISGVVWQHLHYIEGLRRLGHEVTYLEDTARYTYNPETFDVSEDTQHACKVLAMLADRYGFRWALRSRIQEPWQTFGLSEHSFQECYGNADFIFNVCGSQDLHEGLRDHAHILYLESDPGVEQIKLDQGDEDTAEYLRHHLRLFTFGENIGAATFPVPLHGQSWHATRQPVVCDWWADSAPPFDGAVFSTIANWSTSGQKDIEWRGERYLWSKSLEFLRFVEVPRLAGVSLELATDIKDATTKTKFEQAGWRLRLPHDLSSDFDLYRRYIQKSRGEFTVAKDQYVRLRTGWSSDRSACYLAAGRPVITQATGFAAHHRLPARGWLEYETPAEARNLLLEVTGNYNWHAEGARELARELFDAEKVVAAVLDAAS
ncbi:MAG: hypothetical protein ACFCU3_05210 [Verrucomicrobiales bacterium]